MLLLKNLLFTLVVPGTAAQAAASVLVYAIGVATAFHLFVVLYEERHLAREFGAEYGEYCANVRRWLPRLRVRRAA